MDTTPPRHAADLHSLREAVGIDESILADLRAARHCLSGRVPALVDRFYEWLSPLAEFKELFSDDRALLQHVKKHQVAYWEDFLRAEVDDAYVQRRRAVALAHARMELGLLFYLRAMEFVSSLLILEVEAEVALHRDRPNVMFSIRKLVQFDSAIVVHTYAVRTAELLDEQRDQLGRIASVMLAVTSGDLNHELEVTSRDDLLGKSFNDMTRSLKDVAREMGLIARGDYSADIAPRSERDELGVSLQAMTRALRESSEQNLQHLWMTTGLADLAQTMTGNPTVKDLSKSVITYLCRALGAQVGAIYLRETGTSNLRLSGTYAVTKDSGVPEFWNIGEGLVGQAAAEKLRILVSDMPQDCLRVRWGLGDALPTSLVVQPLLHDGEVRGVLEMGSLTQYSERQLGLLDLGASGIALALTAAETRARIQELLKESVSQGEELSFQQEELQTVNSTLEEQTRTLELQKENLQRTETVLRQKAAELQRASQYKSEFLANMSHELRTPLNSTLILSKLLSDNKDENLTPEQVKFAQSIHSAGNDLLALINDILDLSKVEAGQIDLHIEAVSVARVLAELRHRFEPFTAGRDLELIVDVKPGCPETITTDAKRLQQILTNLLSNALKFTEHGTISLVAAPHGAQQIAFTVEDTGIGIPAHQHELVFGAFRQADGSTNRRFGGTGLGLSICRELATLLGGEVHLRSTPWEGSAFTLLLPVSVPVSSNAPATDQQSIPLPPPSGEVDAVASMDAPRVAEDDCDASVDPLRVILVVAEDSVFAQILRELAHEFNFQCVIAGSADEGLRLARKLRPAAIALDIGVPDPSGLTVLAGLKRNPELRHLPVYVLSIHDHWQLACEMGAVAFVRMPSSHETLASVFRRLEERLSRQTKSVLIVEDDDVQQAALSQLLAADTLNIVAVSTAAEVHDALASTIFDCVVLDLMRLRVSGFEILELLSRNDSRQSPPIVVYMASAPSTEEERRLRSYSRSTIIKGARSPECLLEEVTLFVHQAESAMTPEKQRMLKLARYRESWLEGRRILLVEDDIRNVFALTSLLEAKGAVIEVARNGLEALARLSRKPPLDLVLMDLMMPEMNGLTAMRDFRRGHGNKSSELPIIALSAKATPEARHEALVAGANDYISKPIDTDKLLSLLRVWMPRYPLVAMSNRELSKYE